MRWIVRGVSGDHEVEVERVGEGFEVTRGGRRQRVDLVALDGSLASLRFAEDGRSYQVTFHRGRRRDLRVAIGEREFAFTVLTPVEALEAVAGGAGVGASRVEAPIPGKVVAVRVEVGDEVAAGHSLVVLEAMKMENELVAERAGTVAAVHVTPGTTVEAGTVLVELE